MEAIQQAVTYDRGKFRCTVCGSVWKRGQCNGKCYRQAAKLAEETALGNSYALNRMLLVLEDEFDARNEQLLRLKRKPVPDEKLLISVRRVERAFRQLWRDTVPNLRQSVFDKLDREVREQEAKGMAPKLDDQKPWWRRFWDWCLTKSSPKPSQ